MAEQSLLAKIGLRLGTLGSLASIAIAAPIATGDYSVAAATDATRMGWYFDRTASNERILFIAQGSRVASFGVLGLSINVIPVSGNGLVQIQSGATKAFGISWDASTNLYPTASGVLVSDSTLNGLMAASTVKGNNTAGVATSADLTGAQVQAFLPDFVASGASHAPGRVPDPPAIAGTSKFLREDAIWTSIGLMLTATATPVVVVTAAETSIFGPYTVLGGTLAADGDMLMLIAEGNWTQNSGGNASPQFRIKIGGVTVYDSSTSAITTAPTAARSVLLEMWITRITSTTADVTMRLTIGNSTLPTTGNSSLGAISTIAGRTVSAVSAAWTWASDTSLDVTLQNTTAINQSFTITSSSLAKLQ